MKHVYIYGAGKIGRQALQVLNKFGRNLYQFGGFIDTYQAGKYIENNYIHEIDDIGTDEIIVIAVSNRFAIEIYTMLYNKNYTNVYYFIGNTLPDTKKDFLSEICQCCADWGSSVLLQAEIHVTDYCNLNCRGCAHYSPIFDHRFPDTEKRLQDVAMLSKKFSHIINFYLLGGEPFLNPDIEKYIVATRAYLPKSNLWIVTNGILIPGLPERVFEAIRENDFIVSISEYEVTHAIIDQIVEVMERHQVKYEVRKFDSKQKFNKPLSLNPNHTLPNLCISKGCVNIWEGKISRCPQLMYIDVFNAKFGTDLPNEGIYELDGEMSGEELLRVLQQPVPLCDYCVKNEIPWSRCGKEVVITDFAETE